MYVLVKCLEISLRTSIKISILNDKKSPNALLWWSNISNPYRKLTHHTPRCPITLNRLSSTTCRLVGWLITSSKSNAFSRQLITNHNSKQRPKFVELVADRAPTRPSDSDFDNFQGNRLSSSSSCTSRYMLCTVLLRLSAGCDSCFSKY